MATDKIDASILGSIQAGRELDPKQLVSYYDEWATDMTDGSYDQVLETGGYRGPTTVASYLGKYIEDKRGKILDIGAGTGLVGEELAKKGFTNVYAVDPSEKSLNVCRKKGVYKEFIKSFVGPAPFKDNFFAGAGGSGVIVPGHCDGTSLREAARLVKPGGTIVIAVRRTFYDDHHDNFNFRAVSDELVSRKVCSLVVEDVPNYNQGAMGAALIYTVL